MNPKDFTSGPLFLSFARIPFRNESVGQANADVARTVMGMYISANVVASRRQVLKKRLF